MACNTIPVVTKDGRELGWAGISYREIDCEHYRTKRQLPRGWYVDLTRGQRDALVIAEGLPSREAAEGALRSYLRDPHLPDQVKGAA